MRGGLQVNWSWGDRCVCFAVFRVARGSTGKETPVISPARRSPEPQDSALAEPVRVIVASEHENAIAVAIANPCSRFVILLPSWPLVDEAREAVRTQGLEHRVSVHHAFAARVTGASARPHAA